MKGLSGGMVLPGALVMSAAFSARVGWRGREWNATWLCRLIPTS